VFLFTWLGVVLRVSPKPVGATWREVFGISILAGIGFTMSLFISGLAFSSAPEMNETAKIGILIGSSASAIVGILFLMTGPARRSD
jgi:NhaA family Na+:H+ antiporter